MNSEKLSNRQVAHVLGIAESTFRSRIERKNLTPDDVDLLSDYFKRPIAYYFDKENQQENMFDEQDAEKKKNSDVKDQVIYKLVDQCEYFRKKYEEVLKKVLLKKTGS